MRCPKVIVNELQVTEIMPISFPVYLWKISLREPDITIDATFKTWKLFSLKEVQINLQIIIL